MLSQHVDDYSGKNSPVSVWDLGFCSVPRCWILGLKVEGYLRTEDTGLGPRASAFPL